MSTLFKDLKIGDKFHLGKSQGIGAQKNIISWLEYEKITPSKAKCINQIGYGNTRAIGDINPIAPYKTVYNLEV